MKFLGYVQTFIPAAVAVLAFNLLTASGPAVAAGIDVTEAWATMTGDIGSVFMVIENTGAAADRLYAVKSKLGGRTVIHVTRETDTRSSMQEAVALQVRPGELTELHAHGNHIMLMDLDQPLNDGQVLSLVMYFENAGPVKLDVEVRIDENDAAGHGGNNEVRPVSDTHGEKH